MLTIGSVLDGRYKILDQIGKGGMSVVYMARDEKLNQSCAIKEVRKDGVKNFEVVKQGLVAETDILKRLKHPSLPEIKDIIDTADSFVIVMELIDGRSMDKVLEEYGALPEDYVFEWAKQICGVFQYLHTRTPPIIYRDMKPSNIMLKPDGSICIIDFGTAREFKEKNVKDTTTLGTVGYAAPEQYGGAAQRQSDARTDIYNLGATMYHLVTGYSPNPSAPPFYGMIPIRQINPNLSPALEEIILKCCQQSPEDRYQDCLELLYDLETLRGQDITQDRRNFKLFFSTSVLCVAMALIGTIFMLFSASKKNQEYNSLVADAGNPTVEYAADDAGDYKERLDKLDRAIKQSPGRVEAYQVLLEIVSSDNVGLCKDPDLTDEEVAYLQGVYLNRNDLFKSSRKEFGKLCYDIGRAFWFNYVGTKTGEESDGEKVVDETTRMKKAGEWFRQAENALENLDEDDEYYIYYIRARIYNRISDFNINHEKRVQQGEDKGTYSQNWADLADMLELAENESDYVKLQIYRLIVNSVNNYAAKFIADGVGRQDILEALNTVEAGLKSLQFTDSTSKNYQDVNDTLETLKTARRDVQAQEGGA